MPRLNGVAQGTEHWHNVRIGRITASRVAGLLGLNEYETARATGKKLAATSPDSIPDNKYMKHGRDTEPEAQRAYAKRTGLIVEDGGFWIHPKYHFAAASPDGILLDGKAGLEIKCPYNRPYPSPPLMYWAQCQHQAAVCGFEWVDLMMYWKLRDDDAYNVKSHERTWRVKPSKWWKDVAGPEILKRYQHCVIRQQQMPDKLRLMRANKWNPGPFDPAGFRRLDEEAHEAMVDSTEEVFCSL